MKTLPMKMFLALFATFISSLAVAQIVDTVKVDDNVYTFVDKSADFPGGINKFYKYIGKNIHIPAEARKSGISGKVFIRFIIERNGALSHFEIIHSLSPECDLEVMRVMQKCPNWIPGEKNGKIVRQTWTMPVEFKL